jgi:hypothetical protein
MKNQVRLGYVRFRGDRFGQIGLVWIVLGEITLGWVMLHLVRLYEVRIVWAGVG